MIHIEFQKHFRESDIDTQLQIVAHLLSLMDSSSSIVSDTQQIVKNCPHCQSMEFHGNGKLKGVQRYVCNGCRKNFSETTGKLMYNLKKKNKLQTYLYCLLSGFSIRRSAKVTGISIQTSFDWRHKILTSFSSEWTKEFEGIVESEELYFLYSEKGNRKLQRKPRQRGVKSSKTEISYEDVAVIASCDRSENKDFRVSTRGKVCKKSIDAVLQGKLRKAEALCTEGNRSYTAFAKTRKILHKKFNASKGRRIKNKIYHVQNVKNMKINLKHWMRRFNGVATKYLQNYFNWFLVLEKIRNNTWKLASITKITQKSNSVWFEYKRYLYNMLIRT